MTRINIFLKFSKSRKWSTQSLEVPTQISLAELQRIANCYKYLLKQSLHRKVGSETNWFKWGKANRFLDTKIFFEYREFTSIIYSCCVTIKEFLFTYR